MKGMEGIMKRLRIDGLVQGPGPVFHVFFTKRKRITDLRSSWDRDFDMYVRFREALLKRGVFSLQMGLWFVSASHTAEDIDRALGIAEDAFKEAKSRRGAGGRRCHPSW
jgi:glutamate-1-semialdehyde 2,1-aminomutase